MVVTLDQLLGQMLDGKASDLHVSVGAPPQMRVDGSLQPMSEEVVTPEIARQICLAAIPDEKGLQTFEKNRELDFAINFGERARFRVNVFFQRDSVAGAFRPIPTNIPDHKILGVPEAAMKLTQIPRGLVLVTGPTGSGKTTTLAAMLNEINENQHKHIITIEDPIEFLHPSKKSLVVQREVEKDTESFGGALKRILRQDPDVVLIGEMRDLETISAAITVSETGHLVFATLHTNSAVQTINRIIDVFPAHQQSQVRTQLSFVLQGVLSQQLIPRIGGGRALVMEIFKPNFAIRNLIREDKVHQLYAAMQMDQAKSGMQTTNQALTKLVKSNTTTREDAMKISPEVEELKRLLGG